MENIFEKQPVLWPEDQERLSPFLTGWNRFYEATRDENFSEDDLKKMVIIEVKNPVPRKDIIKRLIALIQKQEREEIEKAMICVNPKLRGF